MSGARGRKSPGSGRRRIEETAPAARTSRPELKATHASVIAVSRWLLACLIDETIDPRVHAEAQKDVEACRKIAEKREDRRLVREKMKRDVAELEELRAIVAEGRERERRAVATANGVASDAAERTNPATT